MILCLNLNAAIDKTIVVNSFQLGRIHRPTTVLSLPGGKGANVARALKRLGEEAVVSGWFGGSAGRLIEQGLKQEGIATNVIYTDFESRTCLSILDNSNQIITEIYEDGAPVPPEKVREMVHLFQEIVSDYATVALSGSLPPGVPKDFYAQLIGIAQEAGVPAFLDSSGEALLHGASARPFLIKANEAEASALVGRQLKEHQEFVSAATLISSQYRSLVAISLGKNGAIMANGQKTIQLKTSHLEVKSAVGSGDCMLAGLIYAFQKRLSWVDTLKYGVAAGAANTLVIGAGIFETRDFELIFSQISG